MIKTIDWLFASILLLPFLGAFLNGILAWGGRKEFHVLSQNIACISILLTTFGSFLLSFYGFLVSFPITLQGLSWFRLGGYEVSASFYLDHLSMVVLLMTTTLSSLVSVFSINYLHNEKGFLRFFFILPLFVGMMLLLILSHHFLLIFLGWEGVGLCSYLLIMYYHDRPLAAHGATRAVLTNRIGDIAFFAAIFLLFRDFGTIEFSQIFSTLAVKAIPTASLFWICFCFMLAAAVKTAQFPFTTWLNRAMEGPTPSSALFYGGVMTSAGIYLLLRTAPIFHEVFFARAVLIGLGMITMIYSGISGLTQSNIKGILSFSSSFHLGFLFVLCGFEFYSFALFYLTAHSFFNVFRFLNSPSLLLEYSSVSLPPKTSRFYSLSLNRFYLDEKVTRFLIQPLWAFSKMLTKLDQRFSEIAFGIPSQQSERNSAPRVAEHVSTAVQHWEDKMVMQVSGFALPKIASGFSWVIQKIEKNVFFGITERMIPKTTFFIGKVLNFFDLGLNHGLRKLSAKKIVIWSGALFAVLIATLFMVMKSSVS